MSIVVTDIDIESLLLILNADTVIIKGEENASYGTRDRRRC